MGGPGDIIGDEQVHVFRLCLIQAGGGDPGVGKVNNDIAARYGLFHNLSGEKFTIAPRKRWVGFRLRQALLGTNQRNHIIFSSQITTHGVADGTTGPDNANFGSILCGHNRLL